MPLHRHLTRQDQLRPVESRTGQSTHQEDGRCRTKKITVCSRHRFIGPLGSRIARRLVDAGYVHSGFVALLRRDDTHHLPLGQVCIRLPALSLILLAVSRNQSDQFDDCKRGKKKTNEHKHNRFSRRRHGTGNRAGCGASSASWAAREVR